MHTWAREVIFPAFQEIFKLEEDGRFIFSQEEVIKKIHLAGGIAVLAHPFLDYHFFSDEQKELYNIFLKQLIKSGLDGLELYFYANDKFNIHEQTKLNKKTELLANSNNLLITYGSDCHGPKRGDTDKIFMGKFGSKDVISFKA